MIQYICKDWYATFNASGKKCSHADIIRDELVIIPDIDH